MSFADILIIAITILIGGLYVGGMGYIIFSPISTKSIRELKKKLHVNLDEDKLIRF